MGLNCLATECIWTEEEERRPMRRESVLELGTDLELA